MKNRKKSTAESGFKRKKRSGINGGTEMIDYKNVDLLSQFITEKGKILPRRITGVSHREQKLLNVAIKRARHIALLPFVGED